MPIDPHVELIGASSDHLILDLEAVNPPLQVGETVSFHMSYPALLAAMTSEYVRKTPSLFKVKHKPRKNVSWHSLLSLS